DPDRLCADQIMRVTVQAESTGSQGDREALEAFYDATGGDAWADNTNWKTAAPLESWHGVTVGPSGRVTGLRLWENGLSGAVPTALQSLDQLDELDLGGNSLAGPIPGWLGSMSSLRTLSLWGNELAGPVPAELGNLRSLRRLDLCCNDLSGSIPAALRNLGDLEWLWLSWNNLTGPIPNWVASLGNLRGLFLGSNGFSGPIPAGLGALSDLRWLALGPNDLTPGPIPAALGDLVLLEELYLGAANLTGPVPPELANLTSLRVLSLSGNGLSGAIPDELGGLASLSHLYLSGNFGLSGSLPPEWALPDLERLDIALTQTCAPDSWQEQLETIEFDGSRCGTEDRTVDVAVVYTPSAREAAGGTAAVEAEIDLMIAATNQAFQDSGVLSRVALVARSEVRYSETGVSSTDLGRLIEPEDGYMDEVHEMRDRVGADLVHLIPGEGDVGGIAQVYGPFGLSVWSGWAVPHEFGHNLGLLHDRYQESRERLRPHPAYGYVNRPGLQLRARKPTQWRTIMSYSDECDDQFTHCSEVPRYSNARERYNGEPTGIPFDAEAKAAAWGVTGPADAASVIDVTAPAIAAWRDRPAGAGPATAATATSGGQQPRNPGRVQAVPPGQPEGLFFDPLLAAQAPSAGGSRTPEPADSMSLRRRLVSVDFRQLGETVAELTLNLFDDATFTGLVERTAPTFSGGYVLSGRLAGVDGTMTLVVNGAIVAGRVWTPEATYQISPADGAFHAIRQVDPAQLLPLGDPLPRPLPEGDRRDPPRRQ
ncbi:MAG: M12 family metallo-peptidase, partial [Rhodospirillales bacterium]|nr:M12 family metallo-peptidase [Rhodospirillales bacterium]